jgi:hypothetical protein
MAPKGMFKGEGYDTFIADTAVAQSIDWGAALGAGCPRLALQMIAEMFRDRDWEGDDAPDVKGFLEGASEGTWSTAASPREAVQPVQLAKHWRKSRISAEEFEDRRLSAPMEQLLLEALLWGLSNPDRFEAWYRSNLAGHESTLPTMRSAGIEVGELPSLEHFFEESAQIVRDAFQPRSSADCWRPPRGKRSYAAGSSSSTGAPMAESKGQAGAAVRASGQAP